LSTTTPVWLSKVQESYAQDSKAQQMISALALDAQAIPHFTLLNGILRYKNKIWVGNNEDLHQQIFQALHSFAVCGHSGFPVTYRRMKQLFAWVGMKTATLIFYQSLFCLSASKA
jgi:hypothetical protein